MAKKTQLWNPEWNKNRITLRISLNKKEQELMIKKYGVIPNSTQIKDVLFDEKVFIRQFIRDETKEELIFQLKKIGNNLNQLAWKANSGYQVKQDLVDSILSELEQLINKDYEN